VAIRLLGGGEIVCDAENFLKNSQILGRAARPASVSSSKSVSLGILQELIVGQWKGKRLGSRGKDHLKRHKAHSIVLVNLLIAEVLFRESDPILVVVEASSEMLEVGRMEKTSPLQLTGIESSVYFIGRHCEISLEIHDHFRQPFDRQILLWFYFLQELVSNISVGANVVPSASVYSRRLSDMRCRIDITE